MMKGITQRALKTFKNRPLLHIIQNNRQWFYHMNFTYCASNKNTLTLSKTNSNYRSYWFKKKKNKENVKLHDKCKIEKPYLVSDWNSEGNRTTNTDKEWPITCVISSMKNLSQPEQCSIWFSEVKGCPKVEWVFFNMSFDRDLFIICASVSNTCFWTNKFIGTQLNSQINLVFKSSENLPSTENIPKNLKKRIIMILNNSFVSRELDMFVYKLLHVKSVWEFFLEETQQNVTILS